MRKGLRRCVADNSGEESPRRLPKWGVRPPRGDNLSRAGAVFSCTALARRRTISPGGRAALNSSWKGLIMLVALLWRDPTISTYLALGGAAVIALALGLYALPGSRVK